MIKFYQKNNGSLTIREHEAQFAPHEVIDNETSRCPVCGLTTTLETRVSCLCKDIVYFDGDVDYNANEVFALLQPLIAGAYELDLNPLPALRKLFGDNVKISYWNEDCYGAMRNAPMSEVISGKVMILVSKDGWCRFW